MAVSLNTVVDVTVEISSPTTVKTNFNLGLIIGATPILTAENRVMVFQQVSYQADMITAGFSASDPEYIAVVAYFSQNPVSGQVAVGVMLDKENPTSAVQASRLFNEEWYSVCFCDVVEDTLIPAVASAVEAFTIPTQFYYATSDVKCLSTGTANVMKTIQSLTLTRSIGVYTTQRYLVCGLMGMISGMNSLAVNSAYTAAYKTIAGFTPEDVGDSGLAALASYNGNTYCEFGRQYKFFYPGLCANGYHIDELFFIDAAKYLIQQYTVAGLVSRRVVPQTEAGLTDIISFVSDGCTVLADTGIIASGIWTGGDVLSLTKGMAVVGGFLVQSGTMAAQSAVDRAARKSPPIYVALKGAGAIEHVVVRVYIDR